MSRLLAALLACALLSISAHAADPAQQKVDFGRHLETVKALTAALQRADGAGNPSNQDILRAVGAHQKVAQELAAAGEFESASSILDEGYKSLLAALISAKSGAATPAPGSTAGDAKLSADKSQTEFERKVLSADALMQATKRVDSEQVSVHRSQIEQLELQLSRAKAAASDKDWGAAIRLLDDVLAGEKKILVKAKSEPATAGLKAVSATANPQPDAAAMTLAAQQAEIAKTLRSVDMLRGAIVRQSKERGIDSAAALDKIGQLAAQARSLQASQPQAALEAAASAYLAAKLSVQSLFAN